MTFAHPYWFFGLLLLPLLVLLQVWSEARRRALLGKLVAVRLQPQLAASASQAKRWIRLTLLLLGLAALFATLARPQWGEEVATETTHGRDIIIAIDTSRSMLATDLAPNRLTRVKLAAEDLIGELQGDRVGLVAFAGTAFLQAPLTGDTSAVLASLHELDTNIIPRGGTNIAEAIHTAVDAFGKGESEDRAIILFTDGEELDADGLAAAKELKGIRIFTVGAGSAEGTIVPLPAGPGESPYLKDPEGQIVKSRLDEERLRAIAEATGGFYTLLRSGPAEMKQICQAGLMQLNAHDSDSQTTRRAIDRFQWPLSAAVLFLAATLFIGERRRAALLAALALGLLPAQARATNAGLERYEEKDYAGALQHFEKQLERRPTDAVQYDIGTAAYKAGEIEKALDAFSHAIRSRDTSLRGKAEYNLGNTLFQRGYAQKEKPPQIQDWKNSLQHYDEALRVDPKNDNATVNRGVVLKLLEEAEQEQKKEDQKKEQEKKDQEKKDGDKGEKKDKDKGQDKDKNGEKKDGDQEGKDGQGEKGENGQPKNGKDDQQDRGKKEGKEEEGKEEQGEPQKPKQGEIQSTEKGKEEQARKAQEAQQAADQKEAAEEAEAAAAGKMTELQARSLLDSLKSEDDRVRLLNPKQKGPRDYTIRDW